MLCNFVVLDFGCFVCRKQILLRNVMNVVIYPIYRPPVVKELSSFLKIINNEKPVFFEFSLGICGKSKEEFRPIFKFSYRNERKDNPWDCGVKSYKNVRNMAFIRKMTSQQVKYFVSLLEEQGTFNSFGEEKTDWPSIGLRIESTNIHWLI